MHKVFIRVIYILYILFNYKISHAFNNKNLKAINVKRIKHGFEKLGPTFIKLAQIISTRTDLYNTQLLNELEKLQTATYSYTFKEIKIIIEKSLTQDIQSIFKKINNNPLSSASVAQLHTAILKNNDKVIIKIIKPNSKNLIDIDLRLIKGICNILILFKKFDRFKLLDVFDELKNTFDNELNLKHEASNISKFKNIFNKNHHVYAPNVYWHLSSENMLVMEYIDGINILNKKKFKKEKINSTKIIFQLLEVFYIQFLKYNFFHADLHPGNILISKNTLGQNVIILIDFGIVSFIEEEQKHYIIENILAFTQMNYQKIIKLHLNARTITLKNKQAEIENELRFIFDPILNKNLKHLSFKILIKELIKLAKKVNMEIQPNFLLLQKNLILIEGITRRLNTNINLWLMNRQIIEKLFVNNLILNKIKYHINNIITPKINNHQRNIKQKNTLLNYIINIIFSEYVIYSLLCYCLISISVNIILLYYKYITLFI